MNRRYTVTVLWLDRGRFEREITTGEIASNLPAAVGRAMRTVKQAARQMKYGFREETGATIKIKAFIGPPLRREGD